jgi:hypothetical protein
MICPELQAFWTSRYSAKLQMRAKKLVTCIPLPLDLIFIIVSYGSSFTITLKDMQENTNWTPVIMWKEQDNNKILNKEYTNYMLRTYPNTVFKMFLPQIVILCSCVCIRGNLMQCYDCLSDGAWRRRGNLLTRYTLTSQLPGDAIAFRDKNPYVMHSAWKVTGEFHFIKDIF